MAVLNPSPSARPVFRREWRAVLLGLAVLGLLPTAGRAASPAAASREYQIKAVFLFNFAQFVEWPTGTFPAADSPLVIGVLGADPFGPQLDETVHGERVGSHPLVVRRYARVDEIDACHVLFLAESEITRLAPILARLKGRSILTVSDTAGAARRGVMIRFFMENNRIRLRINLDAARAVGLILSSKLLRPAEIVTENREDH